MTFEEVAHALLAKFPGLTVAEIAKLDPYQVKYVYLREDTRRLDAPHQSKTDPFAAFLQACKWQGMTDEQAQAALKQQMAGGPPA